MTLVIVSFHGLPIRVVTISSVTKFPPSHEATLSSNISFGLRKPLSFSILLLLWHISVVPVYMTVVATCYTPLIPYHLWLSLRNIVVILRTWLSLWNIPVIPYDLWLSFRDIPVIPYHMWLSFRDITVALFHLTVVATHYGCPRLITWQKNVHFLYLMHVTTSHWDQDTSSKGK